MSVASKCLMCDCYHSGCNGSPTVCKDWRPIVIEDVLPPPPVRMPAAEKLSAITPKGKNFERLSEKRLDTVLRSIRILGNLSSKTNYDYNADEALNLVLQIEQAVMELRNKFDV